MRIVVTGATGTVGGPLVDRLLDRSVTVRIATRSPTEARDRFGDGAEYTEFDLSRPETWGQTLDDGDRLFLLLPPSVGLDSMREFVDAANRVGVEHVTFLSIIGAEKLPFLPHRRLEKHLQGTNMTWTFLRASYFMQNLSEIHRPEIVTHDEVFVPAGTGELSFVDARDVAAVAAVVLTDPGHENCVYELTGPDALDVVAVADIFSDVLDRQITYANPSRIEFAREMYRRGVSVGMVAFMTLEYSVVQLGRSGRITDDVKRPLGRPPTSMRQFVEDHTEDFRRQPADKFGDQTSVSELLPGRVYRLDLAMVNAYLVDDGDVTLVDTGTPWTVDTLRAALNAAGYAVGDIDRVLVTHFDLDHVGGLADLAFDGPCYAMEPDASYLDGAQTPPLSNHKGLLQRLTDPLLTRPSNPITRIAAGGTVGGFTVYHTPGHTPGHTVYVHDDLDVAFLGDLVAEDDGALTPAPWILAYDSQRNAQSISAFVGTDATFELAAMGHGTPITGHGSSVLDDLVGQLNLRE